MPKIQSSNLQPNVPVEAAAPDTDLVIDADPQKPLSLGAHIFQLEVQDDSGNRSQPMRARVIILDQSAPVAVIDGPSRVPFGQGFTLSGKSSADTGGGKIVKYIWTYVPQP